MCGDSLIFPRSSPMMLPHDGVGGFTPTPRMLSVPSATIAIAIASSAIDIIAGITLGSTSRIMMRRGFAPWARAASTNSRWDQVSAEARVMRPRSGIDTIPMARIRSSFGSTFVPPLPLALDAPWRKATRASASTTAGMARNTLNSDVSTVSTLPPKNPASMPRTPPKTSPNSTAPVATKSDDHPPYARRAIMSRPLLSQPSRCPGAVPSLAKGPSRAHAANDSVGLFSGSTPSWARTEKRTMKTIQPIASHAPRPSLRPRRRCPSPPTSTAEKYRLPWATARPDSSESSA